MLEQFFLNTVDWSNFVESEEIPSPHSRATAGTTTSGNCRNYFRGPPVANHERPDFSQTTNDPTFSANHGSLFYAAGVLGGGDAYVEAC